MGTLSGGLMNHIARSTLVTCALALPALVGCGDSPDVFDAAVNDGAVQTGNFTLAWSIANEGEVLSCSDVGGVAVSITLVPQGAGSGSAESFPCTAGNGVSRAFAPGIYDFTIDLRASGSRSLLDSIVRVGSFEIVANQESALPDQTFAVEPVGNFEFTVDSGATGGNCAAEGADGGAITGLVFSLSDDDGCVEADFVIEDGSEAGGTYTTSCTAPAAAFPCIGSDQVIRVSDVRSGQHSLVIDGFKEGPIDCYGKVTNFELPGAGLERDLGVQPLALTYSPECDPNFSFPDGGVEPDAGLPDGGM